MPEYRKSLPDGYICRPRDYKTNRLIGHRFIVEEKVDGEHVLFRPGEMYGRRPDERGVYVNKASLLPERIEDLIINADIDLTRSLAASGYDGWVEGELYVEDGTSTDLKHDLLTNDGKRTRLRCFRIPSVEPTYPPSVQRMELEDAGLRIPQALTYSADFDSLGTTISAGAPTLTKQWILDNLFEMETLAEVLGYEGWIIWRDGTSRYHHPLLWKMKLEYTYDLVVTGIKPAEAGKYEGQCGALVGSWYAMEPTGNVDPLTDAEEYAPRLIEVAACSGMDDKTRAAITEADIGRAFEVSCKGFGSRGRLRHPQFERWRDDKPNKDCTAPVNWVRTHGVSNTEGAGR